MVHTYTYDSAGRLTADTVTSLGRSNQNVDGTVRCIGTTYDDMGRVKTVTSYANTGKTVILNQVTDAYDGWGNLVQEWQSHIGAVAQGTTLSVQYRYADGATGGVAAYVRLTDVIYPNGRDVTYNYGTSGIDDVMSQLVSISDGGTTISSYGYLGAGDIISENYATPQVKLDYSANNFADLDRFGRVLDQVWSGYGQSNSGTLDGYGYTYDAAGNRLSNANLTDTALNQTYTYDGLDRLTSDAQNGKTETWGLDSLGNWETFNNGSTAQSRTTDAANEIQSITQSGGTTPMTYDAAGNMTSNGTDTYVYDAWDRLVAVHQGSLSGGLVARYSYDGTNRRIEQLTDFNAKGVAQSVVHYFLDGQQVIETRLTASASTPATSVSPQYQYIYSPRYIDAPILRDTYSSGVLQASARVYYLDDANYNVTALVNPSGQVVERYNYDAYGNVTVYNATWTSTLSSSSVGNTVLFAGRELDAETGLYYYRARYYSAGLGNFISQDPAAADINLYRYCGGNPTGATDPAGLVDILPQPSTVGPFVADPARAKANLFGSNWQWQWALNDAWSIAQQVTINGTFSVSVCDGSGKTANYEVRWKESYIEVWTQGATEQEHHTTRPSKPALYLAEQAGFTFGGDARTCYIVRDGKRTTVNAWHFHMTGTFDAVNGYYPQWQAALGGFYTSKDKFQITGLVLDGKETTPVVSGVFDHMLYPGFHGPAVPGFPPPKTLGGHWTCNETWNLDFESPNRPTSDYRRPSYGN